MIKFTKPENKKIYLFSHNYLINDWKNILTNQLNLIKNSGLYKNLINFYLHCYGEDFQYEEFEKIIKDFDVSNKLEIIRHLDNFYEYYALQHLYDFSIENENCNLFYFHLKGVWSSYNLQANGEEEFDSTISKRNPIAIEAWRDCMEYFNIERWYICVDELNSYDVVGCLYNYNEEEPLFTGNFWWTNSNYVKKLDRLTYQKDLERYPDKIWCRIKCEKWINSIKNNYFNLYSPKDYGVYMVPINKNDYRDDINPKFSIITSSYKRYEFLKRAINSVLNQTYTNWEMLICTDGYDKTTKEILDNFKKENIKYYFTERTNDYGSTQKNYLIKVASGKYIIYLDDDNIIYPNYLQSIVNNIDSSVGMFISRIDYDQLDHKFPKEDKLELGKIDTLNFCVDKYYTKYAVWKNYAGQDYEFMKICENNILNHNKKVKYIKDVVGRHTSTNPKISVIIPTYNRNVVLKECIYSVTKQNYPNIEILVCHDGPSNKYEDFVNSNKIDNVLYYSTDRQYNNLGAAQRNMMLKYVTGDYVLFLDDDNILYDNYLNKMVENIDDTTGMIVCRIHFNDKEWVNLILPPEDKLLPTAIDHLSILFRTDIAKKFEWDSNWGQDHRYINNCERYSNDNFLKIKFIKDILAKHCYNNKLEHNYENIDGWFDFQSIYDKMIQNFQNGSHFVEIGVMFGKSTSYLATEIHNSGKDIKLDAIDIWDFYEENGTIGNSKTFWHKDREIFVYDKFLENIKHLSKIITPIKGDSISVSKTYNDESLDFVFIDANHNYENILNDIKNWYPKIKINGYIGGHDYDPKDFQDVVKAVDEFFGKENITVDKFSWYIQKKENEINNKTVYIMTSHPSYRMSEVITKEAIKSIKPNKIILSSHCPVSVEIQKSVDHYVYDKNNPLIRHDFFTQSWYDRGDYFALINITKNDNNFNHSIGVYLNYYNSLIYAKSLGYDTAVCTNFDLIFHKEDIEIINDKLSQMKNQGKQAFFMNTPEIDGEHFKTIFFITNIDFFLSKFKYVTIEKDYTEETKKVDSNTNCLENFVFHTLKNEKSDLLLQTINENDLFSKSKINLFSLIEYNTILPYMDSNENYDPDYFVTWFSSMNSLDQRKFEITIKKNGFTFLTDTDTINNQFIYHKKVKFEKGDVFEVNFKTKDNNEIIRNKTIIVNDEVMREINTYGKFIDRT